MTYRFFRTAVIPASWQILAISAALIWSGLLTYCSKSTSSARFIFEVTVAKMRRFWRLSGSGNYTFLSNRPGLSKAGSRVSALFVDMITFTLVLCSNPSIWFSNSIKTLWTSLSAPVCASKRLRLIVNLLCCYGVHLINEYNRGLILPCQFEYVSNHTGTLA